MRLPDDLTDEASATYEDRLVRDPRLNALEIAVLDLVTINALGRIENLISFLDGPGHDPDAVLAAITSLTDIHDHLVSDLLQVEAVIDAASEVIS